MSDSAQVLLLDVREDDEWNIGHAPDAVHRPLGLPSPTSVPDDRPIIAVCRSGQRSGRATQALTAAGYDVRNLDGGCTPGQPATGLPVVRTDGGIGLSLDEVAEALERAARRAHSEQERLGQLSLVWRSRLDEQISALEALRDGWKPAPGVAGCRSGGARSPTRPTWPRRAGVASFCAAR